MTSIKYSKKLRKKVKTIDIVYKPVKWPEKQIQCYYSQDISKSYRNSCGDSEKLSHRFAFECYYCGKKFARADKQKRHIETCTGVPGIIYNLNNKNLITFEDNFKSKGDYQWQSILILKQLHQPATILILNRTKCLSCLLF